MIDFQFNRIIKKIEEESKNNASNKEKQSTNKTQEEIDAERIMIEEIFKKMEEESNKKHQN